jgi:uncharacterized repeat protein (TIGR03803 family)
MKSMKFVEMLAVAVVLSVLSLNAWGSTFKVIYNFTGGQDGAYPVDAGNLAIDSNGNFYGTTVLGGACGFGTLFELSPDVSGGWTETLLHSFCGPDGTDPTAAPTYIPIDPTILELFGTTAGGGADLGGTTFSFTIPINGFESGILFQCSGGNGCSPFGSMIATGNTAYVVNYAGGTYAKGAIYASLSTGVYSFCSLPGCADGANPGSGVALDSQNNGYGTTNLGGANGKGVVYECLAQGYGGPPPNGDWDYCGSESVLHSFAGGPNDGAYPFLATPLLTLSCVQNLCGNTIWGTTPQGGAFGDVIGGYGTVWNINNFGTFSLTHSFNWTDGAFPYAGLTNLNGTYYGTTSGGGPFQRQCCPLRFTIGEGTIYSLTSSGTLTTLHTFSGTDGASPYSGLVADSSGNLYGVTFFGGTNNAGVVYEITP